MRIELAKLAHDASVLSGSAQGRTILAKLVEAASPQPQPSLCVLDFEGVGIATGSFLQECVLGFRDFVRARRLALYPVVANANAATLDELSTLLIAQHDAIMSCTTDADGKITEVCVIGQLEEKMRMTLDLVNTLGEANTPALQRLRPGEGVPTLWNNRLDALWGKRLIVKFNSTRMRTFRSITTINV